MDLLNARDNSLSKKCLGSDNTPPPIPSLKDHVDSPASAESGVFRSMFGPIWLNEEYESSFLDGHQNRLDHEEELFRKYLEEKTKETSPDEDTAVLALLRSQQAIDFSLCCFTWCR